VGGQQIQAHGIPGGGMTGSLSLQIRTHLWTSWARIAIKHEAAARTARREMQQPAANQSQLLEREADAGLDGICAAAFALEALSRELVELGVVPQPTLSAWANKGLSADKVILEVLKHAVDPRGLVVTWKRELAWLFTVRGSSVHYEGVFEPPQAHPLGMHVAPAQVTYSAENSTRGVDLLMSILERCRDKPKPATKQWSQDMRGAVNQLAGRRGQAG
jgi:hypothetical protein